MSKKISKINQEDNIVENTVMSTDPYKQVILEVPELTHDVSDLIFMHEPDVSFSSNIDYPRGEYGFHHFIHSNKNKTEILQKFEGKKKVYLVFNKFERYIDDYDKSIGSVSKDFFSISGSRPDILSRSFYKLWEMIMLFDLIDTSKDKFVSAHLCEATGSFLQATMFYRDMYSKKSKNDKYYALQMSSEGCGGKDHIPPELEKKFTEYYQKEKPTRITHQQKQLLEKVDLVTGDGGFEWINENVQEQEAFKSIISQIITTVKIQRKGGNFVCKFFETFSKTSLKIIIILRQLYDKVYFVKPLTSRLSNSEKYAICIGFKYDDKSKEFINISKKLDSLLRTLYENTKDKIIDIFPTYEVPKVIKDNIIHLNRTIANLQLRSIGEIIGFVNKEIYSGDEYHDKRNAQIEASKYWIDIYFPKDKSIQQKKLENNIKQIVKKTKEEVDDLKNTLVDVQ